MLLGSGVRGQLGAGYSGANQALGSQRPSQSTQSNAPTTTPTPSHRASSVVAMVRTPNAYSVMTAQARPATSWRHDALCLPRRSVALTSRQKDHRRQCRLERQRVRQYGRPCIAHQDKTVMSGGDWFIYEHGGYPDLHTDSSWCLVKALTISNPNPQGPWQRTP